MKIPAGLLRVLVLFVVDHFASRGFVADSVQLGRYCGTLARAWAIENVTACEAFGLTNDAVEALGARLGKHLGDWFIHEGRV